MFEEDWLILTLVVITTFRLVKLRHRFTSKQIRDVSKFEKNASAFHLFLCLFAIKSASNA